MPSLQEEYASFIASNQQHKRVLQKIFNEKCEKKKNEIEKRSKEFKRTRDKLVKKAIHVITSSTLDLSTRRNAKYEIEPLDADDFDAKLLNSTMGFDQTNPPVNKVVELYRVIPRDDMCRENSTTSNLLVLHGTKARNVSGILRNGFLPSKHGKYGPGVYCSNSLHLATDFGHCYRLEDNQVKTCYYVFVNKVPINNSTPKGKMKNLNDYNKKTPRVQIFNEETEDEVTDINEDTFHFDTHLNKILDDFREIRWFKEVEDKDVLVFLSHHEITVPCYLVQIREQENLNWCISNILYHTLDVTPYRRQHPDYFAEDTVTTDLETLKEAVESELDSNHTAEIDRINEKFESGIRSIMRQVKFKITKLRTLITSRKFKHVVSVLETKDPDYSFISDSIESSKIIQMYKITPLDLRVANDLKYSELFLHGVQQSRIEDVILDGYKNRILDQMCYEGCPIVCSPPRCAKYASDSYKIEVQKSSSLVNYKLRPTSAFIFVVAIVVEDNEIVDERKTDSRFCYIRNQSFINENENPYSVSCRSVIPAYLVIVDV